MKETHWIVDAIAELDEEAQRQGQTSVMAGLQHVLERYRQEVGTDERDEKQKASVSASG